MKLILGNITFEGKTARVHDISGIINCEAGIGQTAKEVAIALGEELCNMFSAYVIPEVWEGEIIYETNRSLDVDNDDEWEDDEVSINDMEEWFYSHDTPWQNDQEEDFLRESPEIQSNYINHVTWSYEKYH